MNKKPEGKDFFAGMSPYLVIVAAIVLSYVLFTLVLGADEGVVRVLMLVGVALSGVFSVCETLVEKGRLKSGNLHSCHYYRGHDHAYRLYALYAV